MCQDAIAFTYLRGSRLHALCIVSALTHCRRYLPCKRPMVISLGKYDGVFTYLGWTLTGLIPACLKEAIEWKEMLGFQQLWQQPLAAHPHSV